MLKRCVFSGSRMKCAFRCKALANEKILDSIETIDHQRYPEQWQRALRHMHAVLVLDRAFASLLMSTRFEPPVFQNPKQLRRRLKESDDWYQLYLMLASTAELQEVVSFELGNGARGAMTGDEILFHVLARGINCRGAVGAILATCGVDRPFEVEG
jgi:uncharacterized damage-inducible protein DinB